MKGFHMFKTWVLIILYQVKWKNWIYINIFVFFGVVEPNGCYLCIHEWRPSRKKHVQLEGFEIKKKDGVLAL